MPPVCLPQRYPVSKLEGSVETSRGPGRDPAHKGPPLLKKRFYVVFVSRDGDGSLHKLPVPIHFVYLCAIAAIVGLFTIAGLAGSYSRMLLKTAKFNQLRQEHQSLRQDYARLETREHEKEVQAASLGALASEVSALYGFTASRIATPAGNLLIGAGRRLSRNSTPAVATAALAPASTAGNLTNANYYKSLDAFYQLRASAMAGDASRAISSTWENTPLGGFGPTFGPALDATANLPTLWPVIGPITSPFGEREDPVLGAGEGEFHKGLDIAAPMGTPIHATAGGVVLMAGLGNGYGTEVILDHGNGVKTLYGHMSGLHCTAGQHVVRGEVIGYVGHSGRTTGVHVHYEVRVHDVAVNPHKYLQSTSYGPVLSAGL